jgi:hypothetical protein
LVDAGTGIHTRAWRGDRHSVAGTGMAGTGMAGTGMAGTGTGTDLVGDRHGDRHRLGWGRTGTGIDSWRGDRHRTMARDPKTSSGSRGGFRPSPETAEILDEFRYNTSRSSIGGHGDRHTRGMPRVDIGSGGHGDRHRPDWLGDLSR